MIGLRSMLGLVVEVTEDLTSCKVLKDGQITTQDLDEVVQLAECCRSNRTILEEVLYTILESKGAPPLYRHGRTHFRHTHDHAHLSCLLQEEWCPRFVWRLPRELWIESPEVVLWHLIKEERKSDEFVGKEDLRVPVFMEKWGDRLEETAWICLGCNYGFRLKCVSPPYVRVPKDRREEYLELVKAMGWVQAY